MSNNTCQITDFVISTVKLI